MSLPYSRTIILATLVAGALSLAACGDKTRPESPAQSRAAQLKQISQQWSQPDSDKAIPGHPQADTPREAVANRIIATNPEPLPLGTRRELVRSVLGPPHEATSRTWSYIASRRPPADGLGGWCERRFEVHFDKRGHITEETLRQPTCPRANNP
jgi:outer membrane protein assembly factor BamE (lipoprotein component of BamABCDE complex)